MSVFCIKSLMRTVIVEDPWDEYAVSSQTLEAEREGILAALNGFLKGLGYLA